MNRLCETLGIHLPILQAPTGSIAGPELAAAVSEAGALGSMGITWMSADAARSQVREVARLTNRHFAVNVVLAFPDVPLIPALEDGASIVTFSWGIPKTEIDLVRSFGAKVGIQIGSAQGARLAGELKPDFLICQGVEAGGHVQSTRSLQELLPSIKEVMPGIPLVAAGGLADGSDISRALSLGADGVMLGTRFLATLESLAHDAYKQRILSTEGSETVYTVCFDGGWSHAPHRVIRNETVENWESAGCPPPGKRPGEGETVGGTASGEPIIRYDDTAPRAGMTGLVDEMALYCGAGCGRITDLPAAADLVNRLWEDALAIGGFPWP